VLSVRRKPIHSKGTFVNPHIIAIDTMRFSIIATLTFGVLASAAPVQNTPGTAAVASPNAIPNLKTLQQALAATVPNLRELFAKRPDINTKLAAQFPSLSNGKGQIDLVKFERVPTDLVSDALGMLMSLPTAIYDGVSSILSMEYSLISGIFSGLFGWIPGLGSLFG
jgi:hypothetical protein